MANENPISQLSHADKCRAGELKWRVAQPIGDVESPHRGSIGLQTKDRPEAVSVFAKSI
jgi:hypothetical protein